MDTHYSRLSVNDDGSDDSLLNQDDVHPDVQFSKQKVCGDYSCSRKQKIILAVLVAITVICISATVAIKIECRPDDDTQAIFQSGMKGYKMFRLPALIYHKQYFLAFAEARERMADSSVSGIIMRRGLLQESKVKWEDAKLVGYQKGMRLNGPVPVVDEITDTIWLLYSVLPAHVNEGTIISRGHYNQSIILISSTDVGETWSSPRDITEETLAKMQPSPSIFAPGPGHGIQLESGRLVIPGGFFAKDNNTNHKSFQHGSTSHSTVLLSDDHGTSWRPGGYVPYWEAENGKAIETNEASVAEISPNKLILSARTITKNQPRAQTISEDGGQSFGTPELMPELVEPNNFWHNTAGVAGSLLRIRNSRNATSTTNQSWALFSNTANEKRRYGMSIRLSQDGCQSWSKPWTIWSWASAYSDLTQIVEMDSNKYIETPTFAILYERGCVFNIVNTISFKMFRLDDVFKGIGIR